MSARSMRRAAERRLAHRQRRAHRLAVATGGALLITPAAAHAATINVSSVADSGVNSLRAAVTTANGNSEADTITFSGAAAAGVIRLATALPVTEGKDLTIQGPGRGALTISGDSDNDGTGDVRIFDVTAPPNDGNDGTTLAISGVTLTRGSVAGAGGAVSVAPPGSGSDAATLVLTDAAVTNSRTTDTPDDDNGGGIASTDTVVLTRTLVTGNTADDGGGGVAASQLTLDASTVSGNTSSDGGGGIFVGYNGSTADLTVRDSTISGNQATGSVGGGIAVVGGGLHIQRSTVSGNTAKSGAGVFAYTAKYDSALETSAVTGNTAAQTGGGVVLLSFKYDGSVRDSTVTGNTAPFGAGVVLGAAGAGRALLDRSTVSGNGDASTQSAGGVGVVETSGAVLVRNSTVTGNTATTGGGVGIGRDGRVFQTDDDGRVRGAVDLDNSTIAGNTGGGVFLSSYDAGTPAVRKSASIGMSSTIVAGNGTDTDRADDATSGGITATFSLVQAPGDAPLSATAVITGKDPLLGGLADNGGPTKTLLPAGTSPVLDAGRAPGKLTVDQRGLARTVNTGLADPAGGGDGTDIGAVELPASAVVVPPPPPPAPDPALTVTAGALPVTTGAPLLPAGLTPLTCTVTIVKLTGCDVAIRTTAPVKLSKKTTVPAGTLLAEAQPTSPEGAASLSAKAVLTADGRAVLKKLPVGVNARVNGVGTYGASGALTAAPGQVHLLAGPTVTLKLKKGSTFSKTVKTQLGQLGTLLTGAKTVTVSATGPSKKKAAKLAKKAGAALTGAGVAATPATSGKKAKTRRLKVTFTL